MTQIVFEKPLLKKVEQRADRDPLYSHKTFRNDAEMARTILDDYAKGVIASKDTLETLVKNIVKDELTKNGIENNN